MELSENVIKAIQKLTEELKEKNEIGDLIRDDVFNVLQSLPHCTVVYYPIESEAVEDGCDGCHVVRTIKGKKEQLVFINSANTRERQAFSAAHELGHIWKVDQKVWELLPDEPIDVESVINRFAAELLMPEKIFVKQATDKIKEYLSADNRIHGIDMLKVIAYLMNYFFSPFKSTVMRLQEVGIISTSDENRLLKYKDSKYITDIISEAQYTRLNIRTKTKSIANLQENLDEIEARKLFSKSKINSIRNRFGLIAQQEQEEQSIGIMVEINRQ